MVCHAQLYMYTRLFSAVLGGATTFFFPNMYSYLAYIAYTYPQT